MTSRYTITGAMLSMLAFGCSESAKPTADEEACEHLNGGPDAPLLATASAELAPAIAGDHKRYLITLIDVAGGKGGFVKFAPPEATDYLFFLDASVPVQFLDWTNGPVPPEESSTNSTACAEIKARHVVPLQVGTYGVQFGPTAETAVGVVVEEAAHSAH